MFGEGSAYQEVKDRKADLSLKWVKANDSETTYLCKAEDLGSLREMTDEALRSICVDESQNPQND
jgi:hypothetical protein